MSWLLLAFWLAVGLWLHIRRRRRVDVWLASAGMRRLPGESCDEALRRMAARMTFVRGGKS